MRTITGLFIVGVALFVCGIGFIVAGARTLRQSTLVAQPVITTPVASIKQIMNGITGPAATAIYTAVGTVINADGVKDIAPETDEDWAALADKAAALVESGNLLLMGSRALDHDDWTTMTATRNLQKNRERRHPGFLRHSLGTNAVLMTRGLTLTRHQRAGHFQF